MSIKLAFLVLLGLIVLAGALPAKNDEPEDDATDMQDPADNEVAADGGKKRKAVYCWKYVKKQRCHEKCVYNRVKYQKTYTKKRVCFKLCRDYLEKQKYVCCYCYWRCGPYGYPCGWNCPKPYTPY